MLQFASSNFENPRPGTARQCRGRPGGIGQKQRNLADWNTNKGPRGECHVWASLLDLNAAAALRAPGLL
jgi:hypothetical protein